MVGPMGFGHLDLGHQIDIRRGFYPFDQILGHALCQGLTADEDGHGFGEAGKVYGSLARRVPGTHHVNGSSLDR